MFENPKSRIARCGVGVAQQVDGGPDEHDAEHRGRDDVHAPIGSTVSSVKLTATTTTE